MNIRNNDKGHTCISWQGAQERFIGVESASRAADTDNELGMQCRQELLKIRILPSKFTLVQIRIWFCEVKKAEHLLACGWALEKPIATLRRLSLDSSQQYFLTNSAVDSSFRI